MHFPISKPAHFESFGGTAAVELLDSAKITAGPRDVTPLKGDWWRGGLPEIARRLEDLGLQDEAASGLFDILGCPWDGESPIELEGNSVTPLKVHLLLAAVRNEIRNQGLCVEALPTWQDVRLCRFDHTIDSRPSVLITIGFGEEWDDQFIDALAVDVKLSELIVPICITGEFFDQNYNYSPTRLAQELVSRLKKASASASHLIAKETAIRRAVEGFYSELGSGSQIWLRLAPQPCYYYGSWPDEVTYELVTLDIDDDLSWSLTGERLSNVADLDLGPCTIGKSLRRLAARQIIQTSGTAGLISDVALAIAAELKLDLVQILASLNRRSHHDHLSFAVQAAGFTTSRFVFTEGVLYVDLKSDEFSYEVGLAKIRGNYPMIVAAGASGKLLAECVDYEPFRAAHCWVNRAEQGAETLELHLDVYVIPVEELDGVAPEEALAALRQPRPTSTSVDRNNEVAANGWRFLGRSE